MSTPHDFVAVGVGPFNLGLAALTDPIDDLDGVFLDENPTFDWHPGMLLEGTHLQTPFLADLVTLADPTSRYSFLNFLKHTGRLYSFYIRESFFPLRVEYNEYCRWVADQLPAVRFGHRVTEITHDGDAYSVHSRHLHTGETHTHRAHRLVLGTGTPPYVPEACRGLEGLAVHSGQYLGRRDELRAADSLTVVGSGQSAAEIFLDLLRGVDDHGYALTWVTRAPRFYPLEYTKLTLEMTSPEYTDYFHALAPAQRDALIAAQASLYKGIDSTLIDEIFETLYVKSRGSGRTARLMTNSEVTGVDTDTQPGRFRLALRQREQERRFTHDTQGLILATGYRHTVPEFLAPIADRIRWDSSGRFDVARDHTVDHGGGEIFVQNAELHTHGLVAPDLGMGAHRNSWIIRALAGREVYPVERAIAFQEFGVPEEAAPGVPPPQPPQAEPAPAHPHREVPIR
ncbi:lysine N(6)-hydroxylase/L-ornithine N(5)-oxygenase family protein [Spiractinospora alimapuensis]|uniref:lysine N(6)-hydroxylase/L-ornithine N(5)-oxygenase family protein n=1 Tax=Spiractinospora alimapuensis TaxID=2820884 RepID=UPI001F23DD76|nr:lysine N(6)-hydroxylase/L-ornithine N(5)-oxygenase family protein [Spiractinospora alimapuensis]QVQ50130.1 lysine N(6)-hydroxylase/L-ornithine N(5)-oxygenase family protein [Spiractinospora alimapuensis]